jgi:hypothetical protein
MMRGIPAGVDLLGLSQSAQSTQKKILNNAFLRDLGASANAARG